MIKNICSLFIQFSFLPQVIWAAALYRKLAANSYVLTNSRLQTAFFAVFLEIVVFAVLTAFKRFYFTRFLLVAAYIQLLLTIVLFEFRRSQSLVNESLAFAAFGAFMAALNMIMLYTYKKN
ncbi:MAG: hypothetical protein LBC82_09610 [Oscillospiraceae bacterium]|jgi:hypothetical protein|nr:hypothetical protein [Oscillospiraceae bacterium]